MFTIIIKIIMLLLILFFTEIPTKGKTLISLWAFEWSDTGRKTSIG